MASKDVEAAANHSGVHIAPAHDPGDSQSCSAATSYLVSGPSTEQDAELR